MQQEINIWDNLRENYFSILFNNKPQQTSFNYIGSRGSGKTHHIMDFLIKMFLMGRNNIIYIVREKHNDLNDFKQELFPKLSSLGFSITNGPNGNYNEKFGLKNGYNKIIFKALNDKALKPNKGQGAGLPVWTDAENIIVFFEECTQINEKLVNIFTQGLRGNKETNIIKFYAANPWSPLNWFVKRVANFIPENLQEMEEKGFQKFVGKDNKGEQAVFMRNNIYTNAYAPHQLVMEVESYKETNYNYWLICCMGIAGVVGDLIYATNMNKMSPVNYKIMEYQGSFFQGGLDWGDGSSMGASPTTAHFGSINTIYGVDIIAEKTIWNNQGYKHSTTEQIDKIILFYKEQYMIYKKPFKVYVDNAALSDFYQYFNARLSLFGLSVNFVEFLPYSWKNSAPIQMRIDVINLMISSNLYRVDTETCPQLHSALNNSHWVEKEIVNEDTKRYRNHTETHWINSGAEYILGNSIFQFTSKWNTIFDKMR